MIESRLLRTKYKEKMATIKWELSSSWWDHNSVIVTRGIFFMKRIKLTKKYLCKCRRSLDVHKERNVAGIEVSIGNTRTSTDNVDSRQTSRMARVTCVTFINVGYQRTCSISTFFLNPPWALLSDAPRSWIGTWPDNCAHWCLSIDNAWKIHQTGCRHRSTAGDLYHCSLCRRNRAKLIK